ncbi:NAD(P)/FAD-dependent oxidoreductase [Streptomyces sp. NPDC048659]|uniref:NAD(P)/FAD-dependent oxidoreductase n=1 Tax=Streptomyces sp. NPDC048659 TaxID=3155489 RepID=UPI0034306900
MNEVAGTTVDVAIVGAGPAGLYGAYYAGFRGLSVAVIDALDEPGGQVSAMYPEKLLYDVAGHPGIKGRQLIDNLLAQAAPFGTTYLLGRTAVSLTPRGEGWTLGADDGTRIHAGAVVVAAGLGRFVPRKLPCSIPYEGRGVAYHVPRLGDHAGRDVVVVGGGDSAVDWALALEPIARSVTLVHRRAAFRAHDYSVRQLRASSVRILTDAQVVACHGDGRLERVEVRAGDRTLELPAGALVAALGFSSGLGPVGDWGLELEHRRIRVDQSMRTSLPGVYAVGDGCVYPGRVPLISVGFGEAGTAVNHAAVALRPGERLAPEHSSDTVPAAPAPAPVPDSEPGAVAAPAAVPEPGAVPALAAVPAPGAVPAAVPVPVPAPLAVLV